MRKQNEKYKMETEANSALAMVFRQMGSILSLDGSGARLLRGRCEYVFITG
jgi:hypothetical protein